MVAILERIMDSARRATTSRVRNDVPPQATREYDVTDEGCERARRHFADSFVGEEWDDVEPDVRRIAGR